MSTGVDPLRVEEYKRLQAEGKHLASVGELEESLKRFELAKEIFPTEKILKRIQKLKECLATTSSVSSNDSPSTEASRRSNDNACNKHENVTVYKGDVKRSSSTPADETRILTDIKNKQDHPKVIALVTVPSDLSPQSLMNFKKLKNEAKRFAYDGNYEKAIESFNAALCICDCPNVKKYIKEIQSVISTNQEGEKDDDYSPESNFQRNSVPIQESLENNPALSGTASIISDKEVLCENEKKSECIRHSTYKGSLSVTDSEKENDSERKLSEVKSLYEDARDLAADGQLKGALKKLEKAQSIYPTEKVQKRIDKIKSVISTNQEGEKDDDYSPESNFQRNSVPIQESLENNPALSGTASIISDKEVLCENEKRSECIRHSSNKGSLSVSSSIASNISDKYSSGSVQQSASQGSLSVTDSEKENDSERKLSEVKSLYEDARDLAADGQLKGALKKLEKAQSIYPTEKVQKRIDKIKDLISSELDNAAEEKMIQVTDGFFVFHEIYEKLYPYQREGVAWMWKLFKKGQGGVLGDDMGLGKTFQVIAFISGMIDADLIKHILIIMPVSLIKNWEKEFKKWCPGIAVHEFHAGTKKERERNLLRVQRRGHVLLTSYGMIMNNVKSLTEMEDRHFVWDYVILDEGHKIKNPTKTTKAVYEIPTRNRLVLTGTPIQNNLRELWSLYDFVHQGTLLGSLKTFKLQYETPITRSREKDATAGEKRLGSQMAENLKALIKPYFLRRTKEEIWTKKDDGVNELGEQLENIKISAPKAKKNDLILWTYMSEPQIAIYTDFLHSEAVKAILVSKRSPLVELTTLKKICDHPRLLSQRACYHLGLNGDLQKEDIKDLDDESALASSIENVTDESLLQESGKLRLVIDLLVNLKESGHRTLIFSLSRKILDMIHRILVNRNWKVMRLDGTVTKTEERERRIKKFQNDASYPVFLLTTQVGGVGITLTAADRVIIYDPSWNPATDAQAVDRVYRIGQERDVVVYRLITCGTVEEKIYRRQIFKDSITRQTTGLSDPFRYFSKQELRELFSLENPQYSATQVQLHEMHSSQRNTYDELEKHLCFLRNLNIFGISDHDLMFSKVVEDHSEDNDPGAISDHFIQQRVNQAQELIKMEASVAAEGIRLAGTYNRPYQENIPVVKKIATKDTYKPPVLPAVIDLTEDAVDNILPFNTRKEKDSDSESVSYIEIEEHTPKAKIEERRHFFPERSMEIDSPFSQKRELSFSSETRNFADDKVKPISNTSEIVIEESESFKEMDTAIEIDTQSKTENFRKHSSSGLDLQDEVKILDENDELNLSVTRVYDRNESVRRSMTLIEEKVSELNPVNVTSNFQETFQANFTHLLDDDVADLSFDEARPVTVSRKRKSCARSSAAYMSESDTSCPNSASNSIVSDNLDENEDESSNSASLSFVPDSEPSTPQTPKYTKVLESVTETPSGSLSLRSKLSEENPETRDTPTSIKVEGTIRRITPLKVNKTMNLDENTSFSKAMAKSLIITPESSPPAKINDSVSENEISPVSSNSDDDYDSPITFKKKKVRKVSSDSEESTEHSDYEHNEQYYDFSSERKLKKSTEVQSNPSSYDEHSKSGVIEEDHELILKDKNLSIVEISSEESASDDENIDHSDLEKTFATCKEKEENFDADSSQSAESEGSVDEDVSYDEESEESFDEGEESEESSNESDSVF